MNPEELLELKEQLAALQGRADAEDNEKETARKKGIEDSERSALKNKFGKLYNDNDDIGNMIFDGLQQSGASVESATEEAVIEKFLTPLSKVVQGMMNDLKGLVKTVVQEAENKIQDAIEGPSEELDTAPMDMGPPPGPPMDMGPPPGPPMGGDTGAPPPLPPEGDMGLPSSADMGPPPGMVSDERLKNIRPTILSDKRFKKLAMTDSKAKTLEKLSANTELSDEELKELLFTGPKVKNKIIAHTNPSGETTVDEEIEEENNADLSELDSLESMIDEDDESDTVDFDEAKLNRALASLTF